MSGSEIAQILKLTQIIKLLSRKGSHTRDRSEHVVQPVTPDLYTGSFGKRRQSSTLGCYLFGSNSFKSILNSAQMKLRV